MVTIRLARHGGKKLPFYHVTVADRAAKRDGRFIERVGFFNPMARGGEVSLRIDLERVDHWLSVGAQPSLRVQQLLARARKEHLATESAEAEQTEAEQAATSEASATEEASVTEEAPVTEGTPVTEEAGQGSAEESASPEPTKDDAQ